ncbi:hypothetical protein QBC36DRAFT_3898 [Triangularia setosa]|uniref:Uncharacterized protein n=1 Tax=Triangularia setosa TaxID=2587417 RepID=A0AAN6W7U0_9PEZI|nr:hypothetical protein QBC36DRAFT_3898 [Podospora setosa]
MNPNKSSRPSTNIDASMAKRGQYVVNAWTPNMAVADPPVKFLVPAVEECDAQAAKSEPQRMIMCHISVDSMPPFFRRASWRYLAARQWEHPLGCLPRFRHLRPLVIQLQAQRSFFNHTVLFVTFHPGLRAGPAGPRTTEDTHGMPILSPVSLGLYLNGSQHVSPSFETLLTLPHICGTMLLPLSFSPVVFVFNFSSFVPYSASTPFIPKRAGHRIYCRGTNGPPAHLIGRYLPHRPVAGHTWCLTFAHLSTSRLFARLATDVGVGRMPHDPTLQAP